MGVALLTAVNAQSYGRPQKAPFPLNMPNSQDRYLNSIQFPKNSLGIPAFNPNVILVAFHDQVSFRSRKAVLMEYGLKEDKKLVSQYFSRLILPAGANFESVLKHLKADPSVRVAERDYYVQALTAPNDPQYPSLWGMNNTALPTADIDAELAWNLTTGSNSVKVCVIDTGIDYNHPDLQGNAYANPGEIAANGIDDDGNGFVDDVYGYDFVNNDGDPLDDNNHGTHCSGTIGGRGNNNVGVAGVNWNVSIFSAKFLNSGGSGAISDAVLCTDYARVRGADVMSNSWGGGGFSQLMLEAIQRAEAAGILFVCAAGNSSSNIDTSTFYPASYDAPNVMAVAAINSAGNLASFSSYGAVNCDIAAPGEAIVSTTIGNTYSSFSGTSMATPHVAGAAALLKSYFPTISYVGMKARLKAGAVHLASLNGKVETGLLNAYNAMDNDSVAPSTPTALSANKRSYSALGLKWTAGGDDGTVGSATSYDLRYSTSAINAGNFASATPATAGAPKPSGQLEANVVAGLQPGKSYYFALKSYDNVGNASGIVTAGPYTTIAPSTNQDMEGAPSMTVGSGTWALTTEQSFSPTHAWSDSPGGTYLDNIETVLNFTNPITVAPGMNLSFMAKYDLESGYDYVYFEVSNNGGASWSTLATVNGASDWKQFSASLAAFSGQSVLARFRLKTDTSVVKDGIYIDDVTTYNLVQVGTDNFDGGVTFSGDAPWTRISTDSHSASFSWTDSPGVQYVNNLDIKLTQIGTFTMSNVLNPTLSFWMKKSLENNYDFLKVLSSADGGPFVTTGSFTGGSDATLAWAVYSAPVQSGSTLKLQFQLTTDGSVVQEGVTLDDLVVYAEPCEAIGGTVSGTVLLEGLTLSQLAGHSVTVQLRTPGTQTVIETTSATLGVNGAFSMATAQVGNFDIAIKGSKWLRKVLPNVTLTGSGVSGLSASLWTGDVAQDNVVDLTDYTALVVAFNAVPSSGNWNAAADLNEDGVVDLTDYTYVVTNFNKVGDN